jgi:transaldolase
MKFFVDSANLDDIKKVLELGLVDGVTTNPTLIASQGVGEFKRIIEQICALVQGPVSAEVLSTHYDGMVEEGLELSRIADNVCVKLPMTKEGLKACRFFKDKGIMTNLTLCFSAGQALLAAKCGATFVSPFIGRLDDITQIGLSLIEEIRTIYDNYPELNTQILTASIRSPAHITEAAKIGSDVITAPPQVILSLINHPLTDVGLKKFLEDWNAKQSKRS